MFTCLHVKPGRREHSTAFLSGACLGKSMSDSILILRVMEPVCILLYYLELIFEIVNAGVHPAFQDRRPLNYIFCSLKFL